MICWLEHGEFEYNPCFDLDQNMLKQSDCSAVFVAVYQDQRIGFIDLRLEYLLHHHAKVAKLLEFIIDSSYQQMAMANYMPNVQIE